MAAIFMFAVKQTHTNAALAAASVSGTVPSVSIGTTPEWCSSRNPGEDTDGVDVVGAGGADRCFWDYRRVHRTPRAISFRSSIFRFLLLLLFALLIMCCERGSWRWPGL